MSHPNFLTHREFGRPKYEEPVPVKATAVIDHAAIAEAQAIKENKRFSQALLKALNKIGRPRSMYTALASEIAAKLEAAAAVAADSGNVSEYYDGTRYLLSWEGLLQELGMSTTDLARVQEGVAELLRVGEEALAGLAADTGTKAKPSIGAASKVECLDTLDTKNTSVDGEDKNAATTAGKAKVRHTCSIIPYSMIYAYVLCICIRYTHR